MKKILVIDDSELISKMLQEALHTAGYSVAVAMDANQGYALAIEFQPDLILLDIQLPDVTGFELCRVIKNRETLRHIPIIMVTGTAHRTEEKVKGFQMGADDYIMKPFEMAELLERVQAVLRRSKWHVSEKPAEPVALPGPASESSSAVVPPPEVAMPEVAPEGEKLSLETPEAAKVLSAPDAVSPTEPNSPQTDPTPPYEPVEPAPVIDQRPLHPVAQTVQLLLAKPFGFPEPIAYPALATPYLLLLVSLSALATWLSSGSFLGPLPAGVLAAFLWLGAVVAVRLGARLIALPLAWLEAADLVSLAGLPLFFRLIAKTVFSSVTTLAPIYFTASPALFLHHRFSIVRRLDVFELWSVFLLWILLSKRAGENHRTRQVVLVIWLLGCVVACGLERWGLPL